MENKVVRLIEIFEGGESIEVIKSDMIHKSPKELLEWEIGSWLRKSDKIFEPKTYVVTIDRDPYLFENIDGHRFMVVEGKWV
jgi:hypothetical protein